MEEEKKTRAPKSYEVMCLTAIGLAKDESCVVSVPDNKAARLIEGILQVPAGSVVKVSKEEYEALRPKVSRDV